MSNVTLLKTLELQDSLKNTHFQFLILFVNWAMRVLNTVQPLNLFS